MIAPNQSDNGSDEILDAGEGAAANGLAGDDSEEGFDQFDRTSYDGLSAAIGLKVRCDFDIADPSGSEKR